MEKQKTASDYFQNGFNCSQSVFATFAPEFGITENDSLKIACAFGGGMGRQQHTCGAVTGALMALGLKFGKGIQDDESRKKETYGKTKEVFDSFIKVNGSLNCKELLDGLDMQDPQDYEKMLSLDLFNTRCRKYVEDATAIVDKMIH